MVVRKAEIASECLVSSSAMGCRISMAVDDSASVASWSHGHEDFGGIGFDFLCFGKDEWCGFPPLARIFIEE